MEDRFKAELDVDGDPRLAFFGIFDGHSGTKAAEFAADNLGKNIITEMKRKDEDIEKAVANGYMKTDAEFLKEEAVSGSCCVTALIKKGDLIVSNAGDCRAVLSVSGTAEALTLDHRPSWEDERERIENLVNINKQKKEAFQILRPELNADIQSNPHFDERMGFNKTKLLRPKRMSFQFVEEGKWANQAEITKIKNQFGEAQAKELKVKQSQFAKAKAEPDDNPKLIAIGILQLIFADAGVPHYWDLAINFSDDLDA